MIFKKYNKIILGKVYNFGNDINQLIIIEKYKSSINWYEDK